MVTVYLFLKTCGEFLKGRPKHFHTHKSEVNCKTLWKKIIVLYYFFIPMRTLSAVFLLIFGLRNTKPSVFSLRSEGPWQVLFLCYKNQCALPTEEEMKSCRAGYSLIMLLLGSSSKVKTFLIFQMSKGKQKNIGKKNSEASFIPHK